MKTIRKLVFTSLLSLLSINSIRADIITFDDLSYSYIDLYAIDYNGDEMNEIEFTAPPHRIWGIPLSNDLGLTYVNDMTFGGNSLANNPGDIRVDFLTGAINQISFGYIIARFAEQSDNGAQLTIFDDEDNILTSVFFQAQFTTSDNGQPSFYPGAIVTAPFEGIASYAIIDITSNGSTESPYFVIDNFAWTAYRMSSVNVAEPSTIGLIIIGLAAILCYRPFKRRYFPLKS